MLGWVNLWKEKPGCFLSWVHQNILSPNWEKIEVKKRMPTKAEFGEIIQSSGGPRHLSTILLKGSHLFKIAESVIKFYLKIFFEDRKSVV